MITNLENQIQKSLSVLLQGGTLLYPTDTVWGIGCDATNEEAVRKIFNIKERMLSKSMIILVSDVAMLQTYIPHISEELLLYLRDLKEPTSVIYSHPKDLAPSVIAEDNSVAIRLVKDDFCQALIHQLGKPIVSTSANISGQPTPKNFSEIDPQLISRVDFCVDFRREDITEKKSSRLIRWNSEGIEVLR